jgi:predicted DNA-binding protein
MNGSTRYLGVRVEPDLLDRLEAMRHRLSRTEGRRVSTARLVRDALERYLRSLEARHG